MTDLETAYDELEAAIFKVAGLEDYDGLVTDWVVIAAIQQLDDNGNDITAVTRLMPEGRMPFYRLLGLIDCAHSGLRSNIRAGDDSE